MDPSDPIDFLGMFARIIDLREGEELIQVYSAFQIKVEEIFKDIHLPIIGAPLETELIDIYSSIWEGFIDGALAITNQRIVFLRRIKRKRKGAHHMTPRYGIDETVEFENLRRVRTREDILEIIFNENANPKVLYYTSFNKMELVDVGPQSIPQMMRISAEEVVDVISKSVIISKMGPQEDRFLPSLICFEECVAKRSSVRNFKPNDVPEYVVMEALRIANQAPSAGNLQARDFVIVTEKETKKALVDAAFGQKFIEKAPVVIVCCANLSKIETQYQKRGMDLYVLQDVAASVAYIELYLASRNFGSCWVGCFDESRVSEIIDLPDHMRPVVILPIGKPGKERRSRPGRVDIKELIHREKW